MIPRPENWQEWLNIVVVGIFVLVVVAGPIYIADQIHDDTERLLMELETMSVEASDRAVLVNALTIACLVGVEPPDRTAESIQRCITAGMEEIQRQSELSEPLPAPSLP